MAEGPDGGLRRLQLPSCGCVAGGASGEVQHGLTHIVGETVELGVDPLLEPGKVRVTLGKQAVVLQECAEAFGGLAGNCIESLVGAGDRAVAESAKQGLDLGGALPDDDRFWPVRVAECVDEADERGVAWGAAKDPVEFVAQGASRA